MIDNHFLHHEHVTNHQPLIPEIISPDHFNCILTKTQIYLKVSFDNKLRY